MRVSEQIKQRFADLESQVQNITIHRDDSHEYIEVGDWAGWGSSVMNLLSAAFGKESSHFITFNKAYAECGGYYSGMSYFLTLKSIFLAAKSDYEGGYVFSVEKSMSAEILGDFVSMAKLALSEGYKDVAAVLACAALEDTLKRYAKLNELDVNDKEMPEVISALKAKGLVSGAQKSLLDAMPKIRNYAMHADFDKIKEPDVNSVIGYVEQFLLSNF